LTDYFSAAAGLDQIGQPEAQPQQAAATAQPVDYFSRAAGIDKIGAQAQPATAPEQPKEGWGEWFVNTVKGRQDPREANTKTVFEEYPNELRGPTATAATFGAGDNAMADIIAKNLGDKYIRTEKDAHGYPIIVTRGPDGQEERGYVNRPGLDSQDIARVGYGSLPYLAVGGTLGALTKGAGIGLQAIAQGLGAGTTSVGGDAANTVQGSKQGIDIPKAAVMTGIGAAGPAVGAAVGALWRRFVTIPGLIDKSTGQLTQKGIAAAREAGIDPADVTPDFSQSFAKSLATSGNPAQAATEAGLERFGIPATRGQITKDPYLLTQEEGMRRRLYGESAQDTMRGFDQQQQDAIRFAALGDDGNGAVLPNATAPRQGIGDMINPTRQPGASPFDRQPSTLGNSIQDTLQSARANARQQEAAIWPDEALTPKTVAVEQPDAMSPLTGVNQKTRELAAGPQLKEALRTSLEPYAGAISQKNTPAAYNMWSYLDGFIKGEKPSGALHNSLGLDGARDVDGVRRALGMMIDDAKTATDRAAAKAIYHGYNDWLGDAAQQGMLNGDPATAMKLVNARAFSNEVRQIFEPKAPDGTITTASRRMSSLLDDGKADSGEAVIQTLVGSPGSRSVSPGTISTLRSIKTALDRFAPGDTGKQAWNDIRLAYWTRLVTGKNGELVGPTAMVNNLKSAMQNQSSVMGTLYQPLELRQMREFIRALETVSFKPPNASGSGYAGAQFAKEGLLKILDSFGLGKPARAALQYTGIGNALNSASAKQAVSAVARPVRPNLNPALLSTGQAGYRAYNSGQ
jgi:hypothetical protein